MPGVPGCEGASISLLREGEPSTVAATHDYAKAAGAVQYKRRPGPCLDAMAQVREVTVAEYAAETRWPGVSEEMQDTGIRSSLSLPLARRGAVLGSLNLYAQSPQAFAEASSDAAQAFARQAVMMLGYLQKLHAERVTHLQQREMSAELQRSLLAVLPVVPGVTAADRYLVGSNHAQVRSRRRRPDASPEQICDELLAVTGDTGHDDDIALLVIRID